MTRDTSLAIQTLRVFASEDVRVVEGANFGDSMSFAGDLMLDDTYEIREGAKHCDLCFASGPNGVLTVAPGGAGQLRANLILDSVVTFIAPDSRTFDALVIVELEGDVAADVYLLPLAPMSAKVGYRLIGVDTDRAHKRFAEVACVSFTAGTHISLATGAQIMVQDLKVGDAVLTRDNGAQEIRWIGVRTHRAIGDFAPIRIAAGVLNNMEDLVVSPDHRLFIYQRSDQLGTGRSEVLVKARHLVNGTSVVRQEGGFIDYYQILFDSHQIIYAEGIAVESMLLDTRTSSALPDGLAADDLISEHKRTTRSGFEVKESLLKGKDTLARLRKASSR